jgi:signal transduction histidine kinase
MQRLNVKLPTPNPALTLAEEELFRRLGWFTQVRWGAVTIALVLMTAGWYIFDIRFAWTWALAVVAGISAYNLVFWFESRRLYRGGDVQSRRITRWAHAQIACDLAAVAAMVHAVGGVENHFILLFIFPMIVASEFFRTRTTYLYATAAAVLINAIGWGEYFFYDTLHLSLEVCKSGNLGQCEPLIGPGVGNRYVFVLQVCMVMTFGVYVTVFVASSIASRLRQREEALEQSHRNLESLEEMKSRFMRKTSHELRAPIGAIQSLMKAAIIRSKPDAEGKALVERAINRSETTLNLIDDLLRFSRLEAGQDPGRREPVDLAEIVCAAADLFRDTAEDKGIDLQVQTDPTVVLGVRDDLRNLIDNLISNAIRYTPQGGRVSVVTLTDGEGAHLEVSDTGIGIPAEELPHIFEEFFRGEVAKQAVPHGTGLGMAIVKRVVNMHGGRIRIESPPGQGTTFHVTLPAKGN